MGRKLDALLMRRGFKTAKFKATVALAVSRLAVLKNQRHARCSIARSDVVEFIKNNNRERALLRVEQVMKEQNMLDVFVLIESYCHLLLERVNLIEHERTCPDELHEAVSSLIYAATRCGEFPELQEICVIFTSRFGREFAARAVELRNNCGVNPKVIQNLSTKKPILENKMKILKEIASDNNIDLLIGNVSEATTALNHGFVKLQENKDREETISFQPVEIDTSVRRKYKDAAEAAQAAFESAAYAAAAARAAVELSRSGPPRDPDDPGKAEIRSRNYDFEMDKGSEQLKANENVIINEIKRPVSGSSSDYPFDDENMKGDVTEREVVSDGSDDGEEDRDIFLNGSKMEPLDINRRLISVRTRKGTLSR